MKAMYITGIGGLIGSAVAEYFVDRGWSVSGCDDDSRWHFFGTDGSVEWRLRELVERGIEVERWPLESAVKHSRFLRHADAIVHCAAQPSHDYAWSDPLGDLAVNYVDTLRLMDRLKDKSPPIVFMSTNKVYGDRVNQLRYNEVGGRFELAHQYRWCHPTLGVNEDCPVDDSRHTLFGVSKLAADLVVQEYVMRYGMTACCLRCGCLTGSSGTPVQLHGFLGYLVHCAMNGKKYTVHGYGGSQVRDNLAAEDLAFAIECWLERPSPGVFNMGGGRANSLSVNEAVDILRSAHGANFEVEYSPRARYGDHKWWISNTIRFERYYPNWQPRIGVREVINEMVRCEHSGRRASVQHEVVDAGAVEAAGVQLDEGGAPAEQVGAADAAG